MGNIVINIFFLQILEKKSIGVKNFCIILIDFF